MRFLHRADMYEGTFVSNLSLTDAIRYIGARASGFRPTFPFSAEMALAAPSPFITANKDSITTLPACTISTPSPATSADAELLAVAPTTKKAKKIAVRKAKWAATAAANTQAVVGTDLSSRLSLPLLLPRASTASTRPAGTDIPESTTTTTAASAPPKPLKTVAISTLPAAKGETVPTAAPTPTPELTNVEPTLPTLPVVSKKARQKAAKKAKAAAVAAVKAQAAVGKISPEPTTTTPAPAPAKSLKAVASSTPAVKDAASTSTPEVVAKGPTVAVPTTTGRSSSHKKGKKGAKKTSKAAASPAETIPDKEVAPAPTPIDGTPVNFPSYTLSAADVRMMQDFKGLQRHLGLCQILGNEWDALPQHQQHLGTALALLRGPVVLKPFPGADKTPTEPAPHQAAATTPRPPTPKAALAVQEPMPAHGAGELTPAPAQPTTPINHEVAALTALAAAAANNTNNGEDTDVEGRTSLLGTPLMGETDTFEEPEAPEAPTTTTTPAPLTQVPQPTFPFDDVGLQVVEEDDDEEEEILWSRAPVAPKEKPSTWRKLVNGASSVFSFLKSKAFAAFAFVSSGASSVKQTVVRGAVEIQSALVSVYNSVCACFALSHITEM